MLVPPPAVASPPRRPDGIQSHVGVLILMVLLVYPFPVWL